MPVAWVLNLDADEELRRPAAYRASAATRQRVQRFAARLQALLRPGDVLLDVEPLPPQHAKRREALRGPYVGQAWCPTPSALARLRSAGVALPATPPLDVLQRVNHRAFCAGLGQTLEEARYVRSVDELHRHVERFPARPWLLKRPHGFAGRGRRRVSFPRPDAADVRWIAASLRDDGGLQVEPWLQRTCDFAIHGYVEPSGALHLGDPTVQECSPRGEWRCSRAATRADLTPSEAELLQQSARETARALHEAAYFGPFGIDAYLWRDAAGARRFNRRSEINARYTMGWHLGMGDWRPDLQPQES